MPRENQQNPEYILHGIEDMLQTELVYYTMLQEEGEKMYFCLGKRAFFLVDFDPPKEEKFFYAWVKRVILDEDDPGLFVIEFDPSQGKDSLFLTSSTREELIDEMCICWKSDYMYRKWETKDFPVFVGMTPGRGKIAEVEEFATPIDGTSLVVQSGYKIFLASRFTQEMGKVFPTGNYTTSGEEKIEIRVLELELVSKIGTRPKDAIRLACERDAFVAASVDDEARLFKSQPMDKRVNLTGDVACYVVWFSRVRTNNREVACMLIRRQFVPPLGTHYQDIVVRFWGLPDLTEDDEVKFIEPFQQILDSISPRTTVRFFDDTISQVQSHALLFDDEGMRWFFGQGFLPQAHVAGRAFVKSVMLILQREGGKYTTETAEGIDDEIILIDDPWDIIAETEEEAPGLAGQDAAYLWECWREKVSRFFAWCVDEGLSSNTTSIPILAEIAMRYDSPSATGPEDASRVLEYFLFLRPKGLPFKGDTALYDKVADRFTMDNFTCNERVMSILIETGYMEHFLNENEPHLFIPFLNVMLLRQETTVDCMMSVCAYIGIMSHDTLIRSDLVQAEIVTNLVYLLRTVYEPLLVIVARTLVNLTADNTKAKIDFSKEFGTRLLVPHLSTHNTDLQRALLALIKNIAGHEDLRPDVRDQGVIPPLVKMIKPSTVPGVKVPEQVTAAAASALWNICVDDEARDIAAAEGIIPIAANLYKTIKPEDTLSKIAALLMVMMVKSKDSKNMAAVAEEGLIVKFVDVVSSSRHAKLVRNTLGALSMMATIDEFAEDMKKQNLEEILENIKKVWGKEKNGELVITGVDTLSRLLILA